MRRISKILFYDRIGCKNVQDGNESSSESCDLRTSSSDTITANRLGKARWDNLRLLFLVPVLFRTRQ